MSLFGTHLLFIQWRSVWAESEVDFPGAFAGECTGRLWVLLSPKKTHTSKSLYYLIGQNQINGNHFGQS